MGLYLIAAFSVSAILKVLVGLGLVIFVHELGHFLVAKLCGVKCEKFYIGFDMFEIRLGPLVIPRALWKRKWGETEYGVGVLPLGGYVKMLGQDDNPRRAEAEAQRIRIRKDAPPDDAAAKAAAANGQPADGPTEPPAGIPRDDEPYQLDPRSYPAKPVTQRMAIISAGVLMNLLFAAVFAAVAYRIGVSYTPCQVGRTTPGDPAWVMDFRPGDKVVQIGARGEPSENLRFGADLTTEVILNGADRELPLLVRRGDAEPQWVRIKPSARRRQHGQRAVLGIGPPETNRLAPAEALQPLGLSSPVYRHLAAGAASPPFEPDDEILAIDGRKVADGNDLQAALAQRPGDTLTFTVRRHRDEAAGADHRPQRANVRIRVPPSRMLRLGLVMEMGPVHSVRHNSPAAAAGFQTDDIIRKVNGQPAGDPLTLPQRTLEHVGQPVAIGVLRNGALCTLTATPEPPRMYFRQYDEGAPMSDESLGVAYGVRNVVAAVDEGGAAAAAGLRPGDEIVGVEFVTGGEAERKKQPELLQASLDRRITLGPEAADWLQVHSIMQWALPDTQVKLWCRRDGEVMAPVSLTPATSDRWFWPERGLVTVGETRKQQAYCWVEAFSLGGRETKERFVEVVRFLGQLLTFRMSFEGLAGPIGLVSCSVEAAEAGIVPLLLLLTFISVNLAILNFLPIPALDGGHMVFLAAEGVRGKPVDESLQIRLTILGIGFLLTLMLFVTVLDINRFLF